MLYKLIKPPNIVQDDIYMLMFYNWV